MSDRTSSAAGATRILPRPRGRHSDCIPSIVHFTPFGSVGVGIARKKSTSELIRAHSVEQRRQIFRRLGFGVSRNAKRRETPNRDARLASDACFHYLDTITDFSSRGFATMTTASVDPWFQTQFADRIGGANYGKGSKIYKFEKIKRAKRRRPDRPSRTPAARLWHRRERRLGRSPRPRRARRPRWTSWRIAATPTTASPPSRKRPPAS